MMLYWSTLAAMFVAIVGCGYVVAAAILVRRQAAPAPMPLRPAAAPAVTILKPLHGDEPGLFENLASFCRQDYQGPVQIVCGVCDAEDAAIAVVKRLQNSSLPVELELVVDATSHGGNRKISNLANMAKRIRHGIVVMADSDMRAEPDYLARVVAALQAPGVGAVTCLYYGASGPGIWSRLCSLAINSHFLPDVVVGMAFGLARPCFGSTIALRRETLAEIGGLAAFADDLADDYAIGAALRQHSRTIAVPEFAIAHACHHTSARELWDHEVRWARTIRDLNPVGYAGSLVTHPVPWALIAMVLSAGSALFVPALGVMLAAVACRLLLLRSAEHAYRLPPQDYWLVPVRDLLSSCVFIWSLFGRSVGWRGHRYRSRLGRITSTEPQRS
jgi:ceramide glucosyltransferase